MTIRVSPSQLGFAYDACARCLWLRFRGVVPKGGDYDQFNLMDRVQQNALLKGTDLTALGIPGEVAIKSDWVVSRDYGDDAIGLRVQIRGRYDLIARLHAGGYAVVDLKTSKPGIDKSERYRQQLSAYALALMEPEAFEPLDVRGAYLCHWWSDERASRFEPDAEPPTIVDYLQGHGVEVALDLDEVRGALRRIVAVATLDRVPDAGDGCPNCAYIADYVNAVRASKEAARRAEADLQAVRG